MQNKIKIEPYLIYGPKVQQITIERIILHTYFVKKNYIQF